VTTETPLPVASAVQLRDVTKVYGEHTAVDRLTLDIHEGEFFSLLGPSGCGKTTTLRMIGGFVDPSDGDILLKGRSVVGLPPNKRNVNTVFQSYALFEHLNVFDNVAFGLRRRRLDAKTIRARVGEGLELVQLSDRSESKSNELSGGQKQRVALARALVNKPEVLLLDEPLGALDLKLRRQMQVELKAIQRETSITFVFVTHDQDEALTMSDRIAVMSKGVVEQCGTPEDIYEHPLTPFVAGFIGTSNLMTGALRGGLFSIPNGPSFPVSAGSEVADGATINVAIRPEKIWLSEFEDQMVQIPGVLKETVYSGSVTQYIVTLAPGTDITVLEQNTDRSRREERWENGRAVTVGWRMSHCLVLLSQGPGIVADEES